MTANGYVRQSAGQIVTGNTIQASDFNNEYNQIASFSDGTTGHDHSGGTGLGQKIPLTTSVIGVLPTANGGTGVANNAASTITISGAYGLTLTLSGATSITLPTSGTLLSSTSATSLPNLVQVGTITSGTWQGTVIGAAYGGTGVSNSYTSTLGGAISTAGAFTTSGGALTLTVSNTTNVTLPTSGTLVGSSDTGTVTNTMLAGSIAATKLSGSIPSSKLVSTDITSLGTIVTGVWNGTIITSVYGGTGNGFTKFSGPASSEKTFTLPNATANILTDNAVVTVAQGGTNSSTAGGARTSLGVPALAATNSFTGGQIGNVTSLSSSSNSIAIDLSANNNFSHTFTENTTLANPSNVVAGQSGAIMFTQHASSPKTLAFGSQWKFAGGIVPSVSAVNSALDTLYYNVRSSTQIEANVVKAFA